MFILLMVLGFLPMLQGWLQIIPFHPLNGVVEEVEKPIIERDAYVSGDYAKQAEAYASQHVGFREPFIRFYNQYLWSFYRKTYANDVVAGKKGWLYYPSSVRDYYGQELLRWHPSVEAAREKFDREVKYLNWIRSILQENGVEFLVFMAPEKSFLYPEFLPDDVFDTTTVNFNACDYFAQRLEETGFPHIEMTRWFQKMKDTVDYPLIPQVGAHWIFPSVYAADSLSRLMEELKGFSMPKIKIGEAYPVSNKDHDYDNDLELHLNLAFPLRHQFGYCPRHRVSVEHDSTTVNPKVLFIGNSYFWAMNLFVPLTQMFETTEYWYYFSTAYYGDSLTETSSVNRMDLVEKLLDFDYVVWFTTGNQMNKGTSGFAEKVITNLCYSKKEMDRHKNVVIDSLRYDSLTLLTLDEPLVDSNYKRLLWSKAEHVLFSHAEHYFSELASDSLPVIRNPRIKEVLAIKEIKKDSAWMWNLSNCQTVIQNAPLDQVLLMEAHNLIENKPLMRDMTDVEAKRDLVEELVIDMVERIKGKPKLMNEIEKKAARKGISVEEQTVFDARWIVNDKINRGVVKL
ncbi:MAG: hypothetical protein IJK78_03795 [Bacteroidales bacterium]|nr:hypothetical protein [Bacteroidales bacterium]MBQ6305668.1 hypothetical protein [Bacteroidales bacterium]